MIFRDLKILFFFLILTYSSEKVEKPLDKMSLNEIYQTVKTKTMHHLQFAGEKIAHCFDRQFVSSPSVTIEEMKQDCIGLHEEIIFKTYKQGVTHMKSAFIDLLEHSLIPFKNEFDDEILFIIFALELLIEKDFKIMIGLDTLYKSTKYHVNPRRYLNLIKILKEELEDFDQAHLEIMNERMRIGREANFKIHKREQFLENLKKGIVNHP